MSARWESIEFPLIEQMDVRYKKKKSKLIFNFYYAKKMNNSRYIQSTKKAMVVLFCE